MAWTANELIAATGGDWTTLAAFEGNHEGDTPTNGTLCQARIKGIPADTGTVYWGGWVAGQNATTRIVIKAETGSETDGVNNGAGDDAVIEDRQIVSQGTNPIHLDILNVEFNGVDLFLSQDAGGETRVAKCFFRDSALDGILISDGVAADFTLKVGACHFRDVATGAYQGAVHQNDATVTTVVEVFNCTVSSPGAGVPSSGLYEFQGTIKARNCVCVQTSNDFNSISDENYCAALDTSANGANSVADGVLTVTDADDFTSPSTKDYTIFNTASVLYQAGEARAESWFTELCATALNGVAWRATPAIGCFELSVAGGTTPKGPLDRPFSRPLRGPF